MGPTIRAALEEDAGAIAALYTPIVEDTHISFETTPPSVEELAARIRDTVERFPWLVCEYDGQIVGYSYAGSHNDRPAYQWGVDVSVYVAEQWHRHGIARGLYETLFALLRAQGFFTAYAVIALPNPSSVRFHEALGFEQVGRYEKAGFKHGEWRDVGHWERTLQARETPPSPPTPFSVSRTAPDVDAALRTGEATIRL